MIYINHPTPRNSIQRFNIMTNKVSDTGMTEIFFKGKFSFLLISNNIYFFPLSDKGALRIYFSSVLQTERHEP